MQITITPLCFLPTIKIRKCIFLFATGLTRRRRGSQARSWGSRGKRSRTRPYCELETHVHFRTRCCSGKFVNNPVLQICCAGQIVLKNMVPVFCHPLYGCGQFWYDVNSDKCCYGSKTSVCKDVDPVCGLATYNSTTQRCCDGRHVYYIVNQMCCHRRVISRSKACL